MDPRNPSGGGRRRHELLEQHRTVLVTNATELATEHPDVQLVGLVLDPGVEVAAPFRKALEEATGLSLRGQGFVGVVPRDFVLRVLRADAPQALDWLEDATADGERRTLPLVCATEDGFRLDHVDYTVRT
jgi:hypothetical protein